MLVRTALREQPADVDGLDAAFAVTRLGGLVHELANLLDGSMRQLNLARRDANLCTPSAATAPAKRRIVAPPGAPECPDAAPPCIHDEPSSELCRRLNVVGRAMEQMSTVVKRVLAGIAPEGSAGSGQAAWSAWSLAEAIEHAAEVLRPVAAEHGAQIVTAIDPRLETAPAGSVYMVLTAAIRNSIDAISRRGQVVKRAAGGGGAGSPHGRVEIAARLDDADPAKPCVRIEVRDDGFGPPGHAGPHGEQLFSIGFTTKSGGLGIGLSLAKEIVRELGGTIGLSQRFTPALPDGSRGAILSVTYPIGPASGIADMQVGGGDSAG